MSLRILEVLSEQLQVLLNDLLEIPKGILFYFIFRKTD